MDQKPLSIHGIKMNTAALPLSRFTVLDLTRVRAGPTAVRQLADWGANVIKIESPAHIDAERGMGGARHGPDFQNLHRNKRSMTLNLKDPEGHAVFMRTWDLRRFRRMEVDTSVVPRVEFTRRARLNPIDRVRSVVLPLPSDEVDAQLVHPARPGRELEQ